MMMMSVASILECHLPILAEADALMFFRLDMIRRLLVAPARQPNDQRRLDYNE
jgi:hypothetical protein